MPKYLAKKDGYLGGKLGYIEKGSVFSFDGKPAYWMEPVQDPAAPAAPPPAAKPAGAGAGGKGGKNKPPAPPPASPEGEATDPAPEGEDAGSGDKDVLG